MPDLTSRIRTDLVTAMRTGDRVAARVLRTTLSAIANAEAVPDPHGLGTGPRPGPVPDGPIAGAESGLASTDRPRRVLDAHDVRSILEAERDERLAAADTLIAAGALDAAAALRVEVSLLERYLD